MADTKKIIVNLPNSLLEEVDDLASTEHNRSEFIKQAMEVYVIEQRRLQIKENMKKGYLEMSQINIRVTLSRARKTIREQFLKLKQQ